MYFRFYSFALLFLSPIAVFGEASTCKDELTLNMKYKLIKDSLEQVKSLYPKCKDPEDFEKCGKKDMSLAHISLVQDILKDFRISPGTKDRPDPQLQGESKDCQEILDKGNLLSGTYTIYPKNQVNETKALRVYCDMTTDGGGWTVIQRRSTFINIEDFYRDWNDYKNGFGDVVEDFWLGNENIYTLTHQAIYSLRVDMKDNAGVYRYSLHDSFLVEDEALAYTLRVRDFSGNISNDLGSLNGNKFSTKDRNNDGQTDGSVCTTNFQGGWWYSKASGCGPVNLNGIYKPGTNHRHTFWWYGFHQYLGLGFSEMKIRPRRPQ